MIISKGSRRRPKSSIDLDIKGVFFLPNLHTVMKAETALAFPSPSLRTRIKASLLLVLFTTKIRDREEGIVIYSFYLWFLFLTWV